MQLAITIGLGFAACYAIVAVYVIACDRAPHRGGWIRLNGVLSMLVTLPVSWLVMRMGYRFDHRRNVPMVLAVGGTALLVTALVALLAWPFCA